ncbi:MAG: hypothetical protein PHT84_01705 [Candidatus Pacebacteria bacterium]|jgi:hypothetical protein|nr:hypothetical protein [Candidatus Paceibacterota bacterium]
MKYIFKFLDRVEDKIRQTLSRHPLIYAFIGSIGIVLIWRGVWMIADSFDLPGGYSLLIGVLISVISGLFVSYFIGDRIIISGIRREKRIDEKTEKEIKKEEIILEKIQDSIKKIEEKLNNFKN